MRKKLPKELFKTANRWCICFVFIGGFMYYRSAAPLWTIGAAGIGTLLLMEALTYFKVSRETRY